MVVLIVYLVLNGVLSVHSEDDVVQIRISKNSSSCEIASKYDLVEGKNFTLDIQSSIYVEETIWRRPNHKSIIVQHLKNAKQLFVAELSNDAVQSISFTYALIHTITARKSMKGRWKFSFRLIKDFVPLSYLNTTIKQSYIFTVHCCTSVQIIKVGEPSGGDMEPQNMTMDMGISSHLPVTIGSILGCLVVAQTAYIIYSKYRGRPPNRNNLEGNNLKNIANRPPLPLPHEEEKQVSTTPPVPKRHEYCSPTPPRKHLESHPPEKSIPERFPARAPLQAKVLPMPPLQAVRHCNKPRPIPASPKKTQVPVFPATSKERESTSDDEWQYEKLQPITKYINPVSKNNYV